jgi:hypothetical protein
MTIMKCNESTCTVPYVAPKYFMITVYESGGNNIVAEAYVTSLFTHLLDIEQDRVARRAKSITEKAMPRIRRLVAGLSQQRPGLAPWSVHVEYVVDKVSLG